MDRSSTIIDIQKIHVIAVYLKNGVGCALAYRLFWVWRIGKGSYRIVNKRELPDTKVLREYQTQCLDEDHFNRDFKPELARGGTEIRRIDPRDGSIASVTHPGERVWDFRQSESPDGKQILFCRAKTVESPVIWVADSDGKNQRLLTKGLNDEGVSGLRGQRWCEAVVRPERRPRYLQSLS